EWSGVIVGVYVVARSHGLSMEKGFLTAKGKRSGKGVKEKQNSSSHDPVTVTDDVKRGTCTSTNSDVNVDQNAFNSGTNTLGKTFGNSNAERADTVCKESEGPNSSPIGIASSHNVSLATLVKGDTSRKSVNFRTLITPTGNGADVVVSKESFRSKDGMDSMLENGPWLIRYVPLILKKWTPDFFTNELLSAIATKFGNPLMLDSYTAAMYTALRGRASYARAMIELQVERHYCSCCS
nr:hypothetical protein [Tanacetum cinerariifolium]